MKIKKLEVGYYGVNCYILSSADEAVVIDPGAEPDTILQALEGVPVTKVVLTHGHFDHIYELPLFYGAEVLIHQADAPFLKDRALYDPYGMFSEFESREYSATCLLQEGDAVSLCGTEFRILHMPGHTPGSMCLLGDGHLFCGDVLFRGSVGRTDFPGSDALAMQRSLRRIAQLDRGIIVHPGHGPDTTIGQELIQNIFLKGID